jgi:hypothetical protein
VGDAARLGVMLAQNLLERDCTKAHKELANVQDEEIKD